MKTNCTTFEELAKAFDKGEIDVYDYVDDYNELMDKEGESYILNDPPAPHEFV